MSVALDRAATTDSGVSQTTENKSRSSPLGSTIYKNGVNFSIFSRAATGMELLLFDHEDDARPERIIPIDPSTRTYHYWHIFVPGLQSGQIYGYRAYGPSDPASGMRFDSSKVLLDPYGRGVVVPKNYSREAAKQAGGDAATAMKSLVVDVNKYDWQGDAPLRRPSSETIIYEMHVRGFTCDPSSAVSEKTRGTYIGLIDKIPYLQQLGITAVELLPIFQFDAQDCPPGLVNYWGYAPVSFFAPHQAYSSRTDRMGPIDEFRDMVKALHRAGIEVILDVVFNHTAEGDHTGPTFSFRGLDNSLYYILEENRSRYANYSGTGNTLNANNAVVRRMIMDSLRYWVEEMHVDGFRFDLAAALARELHDVDRLSAFFDIINQDPVISQVTLIAEPWDVGEGGYQVGKFPPLWAEWNGRYRDVVRRYWKGDDGQLEQLGYRLTGSSDLYQRDGRHPTASINFITAHDGFTLHDLVTYNDKHNEANQEDNRDGTNDNHS